ncbi:MAG: sigma-70 family RNA polymerase sigma factor [Bacteroidales bacterium]|nr:sigma-70 family RNA polymerase sigma factor [Bacteroidales bacterium]
MEKEKFIKVIKENQNLIYKICYSYCSNTEDRKDLEQEILFQIWRSFSKFDNRVKVSTWIYRIALNTAISFYRKDVKNKRNDYDSVIISLETYELDSEQDENLTLLFGFIEELKRLDKALILLYLDDMKYKEMAEILGISESNVATKINRIKLKLKEKFNQI